MTWQPIETAPRDGRHLLLFPNYENWPRPTVGRWADEYGGLWYMAEVGTLCGLWKPTHWMPLPEPPK